MTNETGTQSEDSDNNGVHPVREGVVEGGLADILGKDQAAAQPVATAVGLVLPAATSVFADVVSGQFDTDESGGGVTPKRVLTPQAETPKLHKVLAQAGMGSRLEMEQLILEGRISVNNEPAHVGQRIQFGDSIKVNGKPIKVRIAPPPARVLGVPQAGG